MPYKAKSYKKFPRVSQRRENKQTNTHSIAWKRNTFQLFSMQTECFHIFPASGIRRIAIVTYSRPIR
jgi:hypothetical protein